MALSVVGYEPRWESAAQAFNQRMRQAGCLPFPLPETAPETSPHWAAAQVAFHHFLVTDEGGYVRGGYFIRTQPCLIQGRIHTVGHYSAPLSEGIVDKKYAGAGVLMLSHALKQQPLLFAMGMGGTDQPLPRMLAAMKWAVMETPFYFLVLNSKQFLLNAGPLRRSLGRRVAADVLAISGLGGLAIGAAQFLRRKTASGTRYQKQSVSSFSEWADQAWERNLADYAFSAVRDAAYLRFAYPRQDPQYYGVRLTEGAEEAGWVQMLTCSPHNRSYFGEMRVAALVDGVGSEQAIPALVQAAVEAAKEHSADLVISNQMHRHWKRSLEAAGFWKGPSNYLLALSKELSKLLEPLEESVPRIHFNRGDGDGRVNLTSE